MSSEFFRNFNFEAVLPIWIGGGLGLLLLVLVASYPAALLWPLLRRLLPGRIVVLCSRIGMDRDSLSVKERADIIQEQIFPILIWLPASGMLSVLAFFIFSFLFMFLFFVGLAWQWIVLTIAAGALVTGIYRAVMRPATAETSRLGQLMTAVWLPAFIAGMNAPLRAFVVYHGGSWPEGFLFDVFVAVSGLLLVIIAVRGDIVWRLRQLQTIANLPRSKIRSSAAGLVELEGECKAIGADCSFASPFYLEDETGRILVDPRGAKIRRRAGSIRGWLDIFSAFFGRNREILLRGTTADFGRRCFLIGSVEHNADAPSDALGPDALVVRPRAESSSSMLMRILHPELKDSRRNVENIFFMSDSSESAARNRIRLGIAQALLTAVIWTTCSVGLAYMQVPKLLGGPAYWTQLELTKYADPEVLSTLTRHPDPIVRKKAILAVSIRSRDALDDLISRSPRDKTVVHAIISALGNPDTYISYAARDVLLEQHMLHAYSTLRGIELSRPMISDTSLYDTSIAPELLRSLRSEDPSIRDLAAYALALLGQLPTQKILDESFDADPARRVAALSMLRYARESEVAARFIESLGDLDATIARYAAENLVTSKEIGSYSIESLKRAAHSPDSEVREAAADAFRRLEITPSASVPTLLTLLVDTVPEVRRNAIYALAYIGTDRGRAVPAIVRALGDSDPFIRRWAAAATVKDSAYFRVSLARLVEFVVSENDPDAVHSVTFALANIGFDAATLPIILRRGFEVGKDFTVEWDLIDKVEAACIHMGPGARPIVPILIDALENGHPGRPLQVVRVLNAMGSHASEALPALRRFAARQQGSDRTEVNSAIYRIEDAIRKIGNR